MQYIKKVDSFLNLSYVTGRYIRQIMRAALLEPANSGATIHRLKPLGHALHAAPPLSHHNLERGRYADSRSLN